MMGREVVYSRSKRVATGAKSKAKAIAKRGLPMIAGAAELLRAYGTALLVPFPAFSNNIVFLRIYDSFRYW